VIVGGAAVPFLLLIVLIGLPPARAVVGLQQPESAPHGNEVTPIADPGPSTGGAGVTSEDEARSLMQLRRAIGAGRELAFTGTEVVSVRHQDTSITRVLDLVQDAEGARTATVRDSGVRQTAGPGDALAGLSERALDALAAGYDLRTQGSDRVTGRDTTVVVAERGGHVVARMWLDDQTGVLLREDVLDAAGGVHRTAAFVQFKLTTGSPVAGTAVGPLHPQVSSLGIRGVRVPAVRRPAQVGGQGVGPQTVASHAVASTPTEAWSDVVSPAELTKLRSEGWPCPVALAAGYVLLDARRTTPPSGGPMLHLTYGDGLTAISVFLQQGKLDAARLTGLSRQNWAGAEVYVREGWPEVMVWQGGPTVITAVGDAEPSDLRTILSALPRQSNRGTLGSLQQRMGSALAWFRS